MKVKVEGNFSIRRFVDSSIVRLLACWVLVVSCCGVLSAANLSDKIWTWGYVLDRKPSHCPFVDGRTSWSLEDAVDFLGARRHTFYMNTMFNRTYARKYFPDWNEECFTNCIDSALSNEHFAQLKGVGEVWCAVEHGNRLALAVAIAKRSLSQPQIVGINFDDFNNGQPETAISPEELAQLRAAMHAINPKLKIAVVTYTHLAPLTPYRDSIDVVSYWCWKARHDFWDNYRDEIAKLRREVGPNKTILQGLYIRDYGTSDMKAPRAMPLDIFRKSVATVRTALEEGTLDGVIIPQAGWFGASEHREHIECLRQFVQGEADGPDDFARAEAGTCWQDGIFLGDGANGVVAYAPMGLEWVLNRNSLFYSLTNEAHHVTHAEFTRLVKERGYKDTWFMSSLESRDDKRLLNTISAAVLKLRFWGGIDWGAPSAPAVSERLSLARGELVQHLRAGEMDITVTTVVPREKDVTAIRIASRDLGRKHKPVFELVRPENELLEAPVRSVREKGLESFVQTLPGGVSYAVALALSEDQTEAFVAVRTSRETVDPHDSARASVRAAREEGFAAVQTANAAWWRNFWAEGGDARFTSEPAVDRAWHLALFTMAASYGKAPMPGLNGLSYGPLDAAHSGPGAQFYTHDQNVQIPMFAFNPVNRADFVKPFAETYLQLLPKLRDWTRHLFDCEGTHLPLCLNQDGTERCCYEYRYTLDGAAYSGLVLAMAWRYSRDEALLKSHLYPLIKEFVTFYLSFMQKDAAGTYHLMLPSVPPEIFFFTKDSMSILAMLKPCLETVVEGSEVLGVDESLRVQCRDVLAHYPTLVRHPEGGWWVGPDIDANEPMFGGHLFYPFYPAESYLDRAAAEGTLAYFWKHGADVTYLAKRPHAISEWAAYYTGVAELRLHGGGRGWTAITNFLADFGKPNGLFSHNAVIIEDPVEAEAARVAAAKPYWKWRRSSADVTLNRRAKAIVPAVIEGSGAFVFLGAEALLQSWGGEIRLFPGVPKNFTGEFRNFLAQGGRRVSARMENGKIIWKEIK